MPSLQPPTRLTLSLAGHPVIMRPSLGAAFLLERRYGFPKLAEGIQQQNVTMIAALIDVTSDHPNILPTLLSHVDRAGIVWAEKLVAPLLGFLIAVRGIEPADPSKPATGKTVPLLRHYERLYEIGTGWLGWSPADTWAATPAEIEAAHRGRVDMLKAIFGSAKPEHDPNEEVPREQVAEGVARLRAKYGSGVVLVK